MRITSVEDSHGQSFPIGAVTVLIGPNNVGKSQTLIDIRNGLLMATNYKVLNKINLSYPATFDELLAGTDVDKQSTPGHITVRGIAENLFSVHQETFPISQHANTYNTRGSHWLNIAQLLARYWVGYLDPDIRLNVAKQGELNRADQNPQNLVAALYSAGTSAIKELDQVFNEVFNKHIYVDYGQIREVCLRISDTSLSPPKEPHELFEFSKNYQKLDEQGHGYRSLVAVVLSVMLARNRCILLDEPEAFLHPFQARALGRWIGEHSKKVNSQIVIATQDPSFVSGLLSANSEVDFLRLTRSGNTTRLHRTDKNTLAAMVDSPILASQRVTEALFHEGAVICESDTDRLFYQAVTDSVNPKTSWFFLHAHNKQTIHEVAKLLRTAGVPVRAIADIDLLNDKNELVRCIEAFGEKPSAKLLDALDEINRFIGSQSESELLQKLTDGILELSVQLSKREHTLAGARGAMNRVGRSATRWLKIKEQGIDAYNGALKKQFQVILSELNGIGLFVVPVGELEGWLNLGTSRKNEWIIPALRKVRQSELPENLRYFVQAVTRIGN